MVLPDNSNDQNSLELGHLRGLFWRFLLLDDGTGSLLDLALTRKNEELSTRNTSCLARLLLRNLMESFFNIAAFLPHIRED